MPTETETEINPHKYYVANVEKIDPPAGMEPGNWYRYVIGHGKSQIEGMRAGTLNSVTKHAEAFAENLNTRGSKIYTAYTSRTKKTK